MHKNVLVYSPCLFGKKLFFHARHTGKQKTLTETKCMLLSNLSITPVICWYCFLMLMLIIVLDYYFWNRIYIGSRFGYAIGKMRNQGNNFWCLAVSIFNCSIQRPEVVVFWDKICCRNIMLRSHSGKNKVYLPQHHNNIMRI